MTPIADLLSHFSLTPSLARSSRVSAASPPSVAHPPRLQGDSVAGDVYYYVQLVQVPGDGGEDDWQYVQTVQASADTLANSGSRLKPSPEEARQVYVDRQKNKASKVGVVCMNVGWC